MYVLFEPQVAKKSHGCDGALQATKGFTFTKVYACQANNQYVNILFLFINMAVFWLAFHNIIILSEFTVLGGFLLIPKFSCPSCDHH